MPLYAYDGHTKPRGPRKVPTLTAEQRRQRKDVKVERQGVIKRGLDNVYNGQQSELAALAKETGYTADHLGLMLGVKKTVTGTRAPNAYNGWLNSEMKKLNDSELLVHHIHDLL